MQSVFDISIFMWALRDMGRQPLLSLLHAIVLILITVISNSALLIIYGINQAAQNFVSLGPSITVKATNAFGWIPIDEKFAMESMAMVTGILNIRARVFGNVTSESEKSVFVLGKEETQSNSLRSILGKEPERGKVIVGRDVPVKNNVLTLRCISGNLLKYSVIDYFPAEMDFFRRDLVWMDTEDARKTLSLPNGYASDVVGDIFHKDEEIYIKSELSKIIQFSAHITTRSESEKKVSVECEERNSLVLILFIPSFIALIILSSATASHIIIRKRELGLLKSMGWSTSSILWFHGIRVSVIGITSIAIGLFIAYFIVLNGATYFMDKFVFYLPYKISYLSLDPSHTVTMLISSSVFIFLPFFLSSISAAILASVLAPIDYINERWY